MWPQRVELGFTRKAPIAGKIEGAFPSGAGGNRVGGEFGLKTKEQRFDGQPAGSPRRGCCRSRSWIEWFFFGTRPPQGLGSGVQRPELQSYLAQTQLNCMANPGDSLGLCFRLHHGVGTMSSQRLRP